ncbi:MAG TPA: Gfo/Idh/MocA family oxidoreductase, partial [Candidatus Methylacidiphilales bacterium]
LFGMPDQVRAFATLGRYHEIEVEDDVTAYFQYRDGTTGVFITSTGEAPGTNRLEVAAERGKVILEDGKFSYTRNEIPTSEFSRSTTEPFGRPATWDVSIPIHGNGTQHNGIILNFVEAILDGKPLLAPAAEGIHSVELANAMLLSSFAQETVSLPLDGVRYEKLLRHRIAESKTKTVVSPSPVADLSKSFNT